MEFSNVLSGVHATSTEWEVFSNVLSGATSTVHHQTPDLVTTGAWSAYHQIRYTRVGHLFGVVYRPAKPTQH